MSFFKKIKKIILKHKIVLFFLLPFTILVPLIALIKIFKKKENKGDIEYKQNTEQEVVNIIKNEQKEEQEKVDNVKKSDILTDDIIKKIIYDFIVFKNELKFRC